VGTDGLNVGADVDRFCGVVAGAKRFYAAVLLFTGAGCVVLLND